MDANRYLMFVGSYGEPAEAGLFTFVLDGSGKLEPLAAVAGEKKPSFLDVDHERRKLYVIGESTGAEAGAIATLYSFDAESGQLNRLNETKTVGRGTCHILYDTAGRFVVATSYSGSMIGLVPLNEDGTLGRLSDIHSYEGSGPNAARQDKPHPHSAFADPANRYCYVPDLGTDKIRIYRYEAAQTKLVQVGEAAAPPASGPRHMAFHRTLPYAYVINELDSTIAVYAHDSETGELSLLQTISTLPEGCDVPNTCAEIIVSPDGKFVYGSNRGYDSIAVYAIDRQSGKLELVEIVSSQGQCPRNFNITPDGRFLVAAHQESGNLVVFRVDAETGRLEDTGNRGEAPKGVCVKFWKYAL